jgi:hypothetical protein
MRAIVTAAAAAILWAGASLGAALAQSAAMDGSTSPPAPAPRFVGLDVFVGGGQVQNELAPATETEDAKYPKWGWDAGATVSVGVRWFGITADVGQQPLDETVWVSHLAAGPRVTSPWVVGESMVVRFFGHALAGMARTSGTMPQTAGEFVVGGGVDLLFLRIQGDYVRANLAGVKRGNGRLFVGGVIPLCLRACTEADGFNVSGRPATR